MFGAVEVNGQLLNQFDQDHLFMKRALALAAYQTATGRTLLVVCRSDEGAAALAADLEFFLG
ncbi:MAG: hypothetical protein QHH02_06580, partial [Syntrophomonadaceae bacterium]|nr:hypothetical protein [Syntrophomonadaceae bacterium]